MEDLGLVGDLAVVAAAAVAGGALARLLRLPAILGYLAAGFVIGPNSPGPSGDIEDVQTIADLGVALLMFTLGIQFSIREVNQYRGIALVGGVVATLVVVGLGTGTGLAFDLGTKPAVITGMSMSVASSMVALRLLDDRGLIGAPSGRVTIVIALINDLTVIFMLTLIPVLGGDQADLPADLALAFAKAVGLLVALLIVGSWILPRILERLAVSRSRELFLLLAVTLALGTATLSAELGLSIAFGAFLGGLLIAESDYSHRTLAEILPLREVFAVVFFVAIGMILEPEAIRDRPGLVLTIAAVAVTAKIVLVTAAAVLVRYPLRYSLTAAVALASMGEFSFIVLNEAQGEGLIDQSLNDAVLAAVVISIVVTPLLFVMREPALAFARSMPVLSALTRERSEVFMPEDTRLVNHAIVVGYTQAGREVGRALLGRNFKLAVIDEDPIVFRDLRNDGIPCILGNPALPTILEQAGVERARVVVITVSDPGLVEGVAVTARQLNRRVDIVARGLTEDSHLRLREIGVSRVVQAEFEVGMQFVRHTLQRFGMTSQEVQALLLRMRRDRLGESEPDRL